MTRSTHPRLIPLAAIIAATGVIALLVGFVLRRIGGPPLEWSAVLSAAVPYAPGHDEGLLAFCSRNETLHVHDMATGEKLWSNADLRAYGSPCVAAGRMIVSTFDNALVALDARTGEELWYAEERASSHVVPAGMELLLSWGAGIKVLEAETGDDL